MRVDRYVPTINHDLIVILIDKHLLSHVNVYQ